MLVDLGHGTIRHRHEEIVKEDEKSKQIKIGYFYHPRLNDFSEGTFQNLFRDQVDKYKSRNCTLA